jgi:hypothetical protein
MNPNRFRTDSKRIPQDFLASRGHAHPQPVPNPYPNPITLLDLNVVAGPSTGLMRHERLFRFQGCWQRAMTTCDRGCRG